MRSRVGSYTWIKSVECAYERCFDVVFYQHLVSTVMMYFLLRKRHVLVSLKKHTARNRMRLIVLLAWRQVTHVCGVRAMKCSWNVLISSCEECIMRGCSVRGMRMEAQC